MEQCSKGGKRGKGLDAHLKLFRLDSFEKSWSQLIPSSLNRNLEIIVWIHDT